MTVADSRDTDLGGFFCSIRRPKSWILSLIPPAHQPHSLPHRLPLPSFKFLAIGVGDVLVPVLLSWHSQYPHRKFHSLHRKATILGTMEISLPERRRSSVARLAQSLRRPSLKDRQEEGSSSSTSPSDQRRPSLAKLLSKTRSRTTDDIEEIIEHEKVPVLE